MLLMISSASYLKLPSWRWTKNNPFFWFLSPYLKSLVKALGREVSVLRAWTCGERGFSQTLQLSIGWVAWWAPRGDKTLYTADLPVSSWRIQLILKPSQEWLGTVRCQASGPSDSTPRESWVQHQHARQRVRVLWQMDLKRSFIYNFRNRYVRGIIRYIV